MLPAYLPNPAAAFFGGGIPIDGGRRWSDGRRLLGDGKTWRGLVLGILSGVLLGLIQISVQDAGVLVWLPRHTVLSVLLLAVGALAGDMAKSFVKRRIGKERGAAWPLADQYDLVAGSLLLVLIGDYGFAAVNLTIPVIFWILVLTPLLHRGANLIGYAIGVKDVPW
jgi:CDP-2,3-bis-(O-geranylgeranyl)-sn-glycerol synthase